jgi:hypothetical protein
MKARTFTWKDDLICSLVCLGAGAWIFMQLSSLERGEVDSVELWAPLAFLYNHFGFYPSALAIPLLGAVWFIAALRKRHASTR